MAENNEMNLGSWFYVILQNMLIGFKLLKLVDMSWWKVLSPTFGMAAMVIVTVTILTLNDLHEKRK